MVQRPHTYKDSRVPLLNLEALAVDKIQVSHLENSILRIILMIYIEYRVSLFILERGFQFAYLASSDMLWIHKGSSFSSIGVYCGFMTHEHIFRPNSHHLY